MALYRITQENIHPRFRTDGELAIYFDWMSRKAPFSELSLRQELARRLSEIPGVEIPPQKLSKRPRIRLSLLTKPESMQSFRSAFEWWLGQVQESEGTDP